MFHNSKLKLKPKNGGQEDPVICGTGNLKITSSRAKTIFVFDLKLFSNLKTISLHVPFRTIRYLCPN